MSELFNIVTISGQDSYKFLQGQITADLDQLDKLNQQSHKSILSAYCNIKGRVIAVFYISKASDNCYDLLFLGNCAEAFVTKIKKYSIFSKIQISDIKPVSSNLPNNFQDLNCDIPYLINHKIPIITANTSELFLPDNLNLIDLNAISFKKGCFLGQEIIARVYYKGKTKQKLHLIKFNNFANILPGDNLILDDQNNTVAGQLVYSLKDIGYAVIEDRFLAEDLYIKTEKIIVQN